MKPMYVLSMLVDGKREVLSGAYTSFYIAKNVAREKALHHTKKINKQVTLEIIETKIKKEECEYIFIKTSVVANPTSKNVKWF